MYTSQCGCVALSSKHWAVRLYICEWALRAGELEAAFELGSYAQTAICTEECACFVLGAKDFERLVTRRNPSSISFLRDSADRKLRLRVARLERALESAVSSQVPHVPLVHALVQRLDNEAEQRGAARGRMGKRTSVQF